jgi:ubiquinone/menaquinone biosynthesis C-methylase UbiE
VQGSRGLFRRIDRRIKEAARILGMLGYECRSVSPQEFYDYMTGETPTGDSITLFDVLDCEYLMVHEVAEISELKKMNVPINKQTVVMHYPNVYEAHITALNYELTYFSNEGDYDSIRRLLASPSFQENLSDPYLPPEFAYLRKELEPRFKSMVAKFCGAIKEGGMGATSVEHKMIIQDYYSKRAHDYDRQKARTWKSSDGFSECIINEIVGAAYRKNNGIAIEAGIGSGRISHLLAGRTNLFVIGIDLSKSMLGLAKGKTPPGYSRIALLLADFEYLPFKNQSTDFLFCVSALHYVDSSSLALREFSRVLKASGVFAAGDLSVHELDNDHFLDRLEKAMSLAHGKYYRPSEMIAELKENGFQVDHSSVNCYRKSFKSLIEDKVNYFGTLRVFSDLIAGATDEQRKLYDIREEDLELPYLVVVTTKVE